MPVTLFRPTALQGTLNLQTANDAYTLNGLGGLSQIRVQTVKYSGTWGAGVITLEQSIDGVTWYALDDGAVTYTGETLSGRIALNGIRIVRFRVSTTQAGACTVRVWAFATQTDLGALQYRVLSGGFS